MRSLVIGVPVLVILVGSARVLGRVSVAEKKNHCNQRNLWRVGFIWPELLNHHSSEKGVGKGTQAGQEPGALS